MKKEQLDRIEQKLDELLKIERQRNILNQIEAVTKFAKSLADDIGKAVKEGTLAGEENAKGQKPINFPKQPLFYTGGFTNKYYTRDFTAPLILQDGERYLTEAGEVVTIKFVNDPAFGRISCDNKGRLYNLNGKALYDNYGSIKELFRVKEGVRYITKDNCVVELSKKDNQTYNYYAQKRGWFNRKGNFNWGDGTYDIVRELRLEEGKPYAKRNGDLIVYNNSHPYYSSNGDYIIHGRHITDLDIIDYWL